MMTTSSRVLLATSFALLMPAAACSDPDAEVDTGQPDSSGTSTSDSSTTGTEATDPTTSGTTSTTTTGGDGDSTSTSTGESADEPGPEQYDGEPFDWQGFGWWDWYEFPDAFCRDGSNTGVWVRYGRGPGLVIYLEGGGACFNALTCANNEASYDPWAVPHDGVLEEDPELNPVGDWNFVYVPYCTGDVHAGARTDVEIPGVEGVQQFVGYSNIGAYLERIVPTFGAAPNVLVTGSSAGGFGAGVNFDRIARAFPKARVTLLDDSGPPLPDDVLAPCLQQQWSDLWGFDDTLPQDCDECFPSEGGGMAGLAHWLGTKYSKRQLGLVSSTGDLIIRFFFGYGNDECMPKTINLPAAQFEAGLVDLRDNYIADPAGAWSTYLVGDNDHHVFLFGSEFSYTSVDGVEFREWFRQLLKGNASHVGP